MRCNICGRELWTEDPKELLVKQQDGTRMRLDVCDRCWKIWTWAQELKEDRRTVMDDAGAAAVHCPVD